MHTTHAKYLCRHIHAYKSCEQYMSDYFCSHSNQMDISWSHSELKTIDKFVKQIRSYIDRYRRDSDLYSAYNLVTELEQLRNANYNTNNINLPINVYHFLNGGYYYEFQDIINDIETIDINKLSEKEIEQLQNNDNIMSEIQYNCNNINTYHKHLVNENYNIIKAFSRLQYEIKDANIHDMHISANVLTNILNNHVITKIVLTNITSDVVSLSDMSSFSELRHVEFINFNTPHLQTCFHLFSNCQELRYVDITGWNAPNLIYANYMFAECYKLNQVKGINSFVQSRVRTLQGMFSECHNLQTIDVTGWNISNVTNISYMFYNCKKLRTIIGFERLILFSIIDINLMFDGCDRLNNITITFGDDTDVDKEKITSMFGNNDEGCDLYVMVNTKCEKFAIGLS